MTDQLKKSVNLLPEYLRTDKNAKFLASTLDQLIQTPQLERIDGFVGSKITPNFDPTKDFYIPEVLPLRKEYPLEPALVFKDQYSNITDVVGFDDIVNEIGIQGGKNDNLDRLFRTDYYSYDPFINWDMLINFNQYYWLPDGPESITIDQLLLDVNESIIGKSSYLMPNGHYLSNGMKVIFLDDVIPTTYKNNEYIVEGVGSSIKLINFALLSVPDSLASVYDETFDTAGFDAYPFDGNKKIATEPEYITINRGSRDLNPWSCYNRWVHKDVISSSAIINKQVGVFPLNSRAQRPIIEFVADIQLYNFGTNGIKNVDLIDNTTTDALGTVDGSLGYYVDGVLLEQGHRVIFNADADDAVRGQIYEVDFDLSGDVPVLKLKLGFTLVANQYATDALKMVIGLLPENLDYDLNGDGAVTLSDSIAYQKLAVGLPIGFTPSVNSNYNSLIAEMRLLANPHNLDSTNVNIGLTNAGTSWYYNESTSTWIYSQQHNKLNQPPLFDLYDSNGNSYSNTLYHNSDFVGSKIFGYDVGTGTPDKVLGFPLNYQNSIGVGSYLFRNHFMTDKISIIVNKASSVITTGVTFAKINNNISNVWKNTERYQIPVIEIQTVDSSTASLIVTAFDNPVSLPTSLNTYVNGIKIPTTFSKVGSNLVVTSTSTTFAENDTVQLKIITDQVPNTNGYYETPLSLTNNPLNGNIDTMTLSELSDHLETMARRDPNFTGVFTGSNNLRDLSGFAKYGSRLIINSNPIAFAQTFLGKKEHNVVDAIRHAGDEYNQFKMNILRTSVGISGDLSSADALDEILAIINSTKDIKSSYYRSDMLGYGLDKKTITYTVTNTAKTKYATNIAFNLTDLSFKSLLVYINDIQLVEGINYTIDSIDEAVLISKPLALGDVITICYYADTVGCFVPSTPTKLGLYPKFTPMMYDDNTYIESPSISVIQGHDGSIIKAYGDYRDNIILEFEKRIYNNIKVEYDPNIININTILPSAFRSSGYTDNEANDILKNDFNKWLGIYNINAFENAGVDDGNPYTWNYKGSSDLLLNTELSGYWRGLYKKFYDTDRPHTHPWEMFGYINKPDWWDTYYSWTRPSPRAALIQAITLGKTQQPPSTVIDSNYARPGFSSIIPVDEEGNLKAPSTFLTTTVSYYNKRANWVFGDNSPAETAWRKSSYWPFALNAAAALLYPCTYTSKLYDVSRTTVNSLNQVTYLDDDLYLNPSKLVVPTTDSDQIAGFGVYVIENGTRKNQNYTSLLQQDLTYLNFNLFHKLGGFTSKEKLQITIDSIDPVSTSPGVALPPEDYSLILNVSNPIKSASISGIVVQKYNGKFLVKGYDKTRPYFEILKPIKNAASGAVTVGGISESFTDWSGGSSTGNISLSAIEITTANSTTTRYYKQGQTVRYNNRYYRVKVGHTAQNTFDTALFEQLPSLPMKGGASAQRSTRFEKSITQVPYGTECVSVQDVYDLIIGYGAFLESQGFLFDEFNTNLNEMMDWAFTGKEFLYWTTQNWADGNLITLSPFADYLKYTFIDSVVDNITTGKYEYSLLKADGKPFPIDNFTLSREDGVCTIKTVDTEEGLFFATLNSVQKEHGMVFNNSTIFNDTIYDISTGYKQRRIKLSGFRTKNWNGDFSSPGFVYDNVEVADWAVYGTYLPGSVVRYNGSYYESNKKISGDATFEFKKWIKLSEKPIPQLLPNFEYKIAQFEDFYSLDIDNFDATQQQLAQHLVGYTPRVYLNNIFTNPVTQYKFYQGFIKEKGTKNAIDKFSKAGYSQNLGTIEFNEEWAFRVGSYGSFSSYNELEFPLNEASALENPYIIELTDTVPSNPGALVNYITPSELLLTPTDYTSASAFTTYPGTNEDTNIELTTAGYVRLDDVTSTAYNKNSLLDIANADLIKEGDTIWLGFLENGGWSVYRYSEQPAKITGVFVNAPGEAITFVTDSHHKLSVGEIVSVVRFNGQVDGVHVVTSIPSLNQFAVSSKLTSIVNDDLLSYGSLFKFASARYPDLKTLSSVTDLLKLSEGEKVWIDSGVEGKWQVYEKIKNYVTASTFKSNAAYIGQQFGRSISVSNDSPVLIISSPSWSVNTSVNRGKLWVYDKEGTEFIKQYDYTLNSDTKTYCENSTATLFGYSLAYDIGKGLYIAGAPAASKIRAPSSYNVLILSTGTGTAKAFEYEGIVKISSRDLKSNTENTKAVIVSPFAGQYETATHARFGHSVYINQPAASSLTTLLIGAPGDSVNTGTGHVYAYSINAASTVTIHSSGIELNSHVSLPWGSQFGHKIAGNDSGSVIAISAPGYVGNGYKGIIQLYTGTNLTYAQTISSPFGTADQFGDDVVVSSNGSYILVSSVNAKLSSESSGKVAIYAKNIRYKATRAQVILALAENLLAPVYYGEITILNWMTVGLAGFNQFWIDYRANNPTDAAIYDAQRAADALNAVETRADVIRAYQNNPDAQLYPEEAGIRYWMLNGMFGGTAFNASVTATNMLNPAQYALNLAERSAVSSLSDYVLHQIINNPLPSYDLKFGYAMAISEDNSTLAISSLGTNRSNFTKFDIGNKISDTTFDNDSTKFFNAVTESGAVYVYTNLDGNFIQSEEITNSDNVDGNVFGRALAITNNSILVGASAYSGIGQIPTADNSRVYKFDKIDSAIGSWKLRSQQEDLVNVSTIKRVALIDSLKEELVDYLDVIDPLKGKIAGTAEQELSYKSAFDPATYSIGMASSVNDTEANWIDDHLGELWWDLSTAKYQWYEQGDDVFRKNNWGKLFPGASIDVYEWIRSDVLPSEWASIADTNAGLTRGISGQPKYPNNSVISVKQIFNNVTNAFENVYYFWVKNKVTVPATKNRRISSYQVASLISDPVANGLKFAEILSANSIALANVQPMLIGNRINANIVTDNSIGDIPRHTEWLLLEENNENSVPTAMLEKKLFDSLLGHDENGSFVPAIDLTYRNRYGIDIRPQQTMFKDRAEALRNQIEFTNSVLLANRIRDNFNISNFKKKEEIPDPFFREYDFTVEDAAALDLVSTTNYVRAELTCFVYNGKIRSVVVTNPGFGYTLPPNVTVNSSSTTDAEILTKIDTQGRVVSASVINPGSNFVVAPSLTVRPHTVIVQANENFGFRWTTHAYNYNPTSPETKWIRIKTQQYDVTNYWKYVDWVSATYNQYKDYNFVVSEVYELSKLGNAVPGDYVKVTNAGSGRYIIVEKTTGIGNFAPSYDIVYSELSTIQILDSIWNNSSGNYSFDDATLDETLYDQLPDAELSIILHSLKDDIFINELKIYWNKFFFKAVKYALTEQKLLDWAFKTSFINVTNKISNLDQRPVYKLDNDSYIEDYIKEVKPYHTQLRNFKSQYAYAEGTFEGTSLDITDYDLPPYFNTATQLVEVVQLGTPTESKLSSYPWKSWANNFTSTVATIIVAEPGAGYFEQPTVSILGGGPRVTSTATAEAYLRNGSIYQILITDPGAGYTRNPVVSITGGGPLVTTNATASATLLNTKIRKNSIRMKFDRVSATSDIGEIQVTDTFVCPGNVDSFVLSWLAEPDKLTITPLLDDRLILGTDYKIEYYTKKYNGHFKNYSKFVFLSVVPGEGQIFKITYNKNINLFTAVDRINKFYTGTNSLSSLMTGTEYPATILQGLPFSYTTPWGISPYETGPWGDLTDYYASAKLISTASIGQTILTLNTTTNIVPGQLVDVLGSQSHKFRTDTIVMSVSTATRQITISSPAHLIKSIESSSTLTGATVVYKTKKPFNGDLITGDIVFISGVTTPGYNGQYVITKTDGNSLFEIVSTGTVTTMIPVISSTATVKASSVLTRIDSHVEYLDSFITTVTNVTSTTVLTYSNISDVARASVTVNGVTTGSAYYSLVSDSTIAGRAKVNVANLNSNISNTISVTLYSDPMLELWKYNTNFAALTASISGGPFSSYTPNKVINGDAFLSANSSYAPEELVPGHVLDSVGVNVYTKADYSYATLLAGEFVVRANAETTVILGITPTESMGIMVNVGGKILIRSKVSAGGAFGPDEFFIDGNVMTIHAQPATGPSVGPSNARGGYTIVDTGGNGVIDGDIVTIQDSTYALVSSLSSIDDIKRAYVMVDGVAINAVTTTTDFGYMLEAISPTNDRASAKVYNIPPGFHTIEAWFFDSIYSQFNTLTEDIIGVGTLTESTFVLPHPVSIVGPASAQVIVEVGTETNQYVRKRLVPPWVSYYTVRNGQTVFAIDNKHTRASGTYNIDNVKVYANGIELRPGFDYTIDSVASNVITTPGYLIDNDDLAIMGLIDYEYLISGNILQLATPIKNNTIKILSFVDNSEMRIRTERFDANPSRKFTLSRPALNDSYVWVTVNGSPLIARYDFEILDNMRTIQIDPSYTFNTSAKIMVTSIDSPEYGNKILGYRVANDMFGKLHFTRLSKFHSTFLTKELSYTDTEIFVQDASTLTTPNPARNIPGVVLIDGERIEFFSKSGNVLSQLRRNTLGTGPAFYSEVGTKVVDQSLQQTIYTPDEKINIQNINSSNTATYTIVKSANAFTAGTTGTAIVLSTSTFYNLPAPAAVDQVNVFYGGRQLRKRSLIVHDSSKAYDTTSTSISVLPPEFTINTSTQALTLNIDETITTGTLITVVQKLGHVWTGTESLLTSDCVQANFLRIKEAELPDVYYYGGDPVLTEDNNFPLNDDTDEPLKGY